MFLSQASLAALNALAGGVIVTRAIRGAALQEINRLLPTDESFSALITRSSGFFRTLTRRALVASSIRRLQEANDPNFDGQITGV